MKSGPRLACIALLAALGAHSRALYAQAAEQDALHACAHAYEQAQEQRHAGALVSARDELSRCEQNDCPAFIRSDCTRWLGEVVAEQPTLLLVAKRGASELSEVRVSIGDRVLAERLSGQPIDLDPGSYDLRFETAGSAPVLRHVLVQSGQKNQRVEVAFEPLSEQPTPSRSGGSAPGASASLAAPRALESDARRSRVLPWTLLAVGAAGLVTGVGLDLWARTDEQRLADSCSPDCSDAQLRPVRNKYFVGDLSAGIGLASISVAAYLFLTRPPLQASVRAPLPLSVAVGQNSLFAGYRGQF
jgi:hypothetical protein